MCSTGCTARARSQLEVVPQGNLAERIRAAGAGIGAFFCPTGVGTPLAEGKEARTIDGRDYVLEYPIRGDVALIGAHIGDTAGKPVVPQDRPQLRAGDGHRRRADHRRGRRASSTAGDIDPETVVTPGIFVDRILDLSASTTQHTNGGGLMTQLRGPLERGNTSTAARWTAANSRPSSHATFQPARMSTSGSANPPPSPNT